MRSLPWTHLEQFRLDHPLFGGAPGTAEGAFELPIHPDEAPFRVLASTDHGWEHVSVSLPHRNPLWGEMCAIKRLFWLDEEAVMQLHPPQSDWVNNHPHCLHLWRPLHASIPLPPSILVGVAALGDLTTPA